MFRCADGSLRAWGAAAFPGAHADYTGSRLPAPRLHTGAPGLAFFCGTWESSCSALLRGEHLATLPSPPPLLTHPAI